MTARQGPPGRSSPSLTGILKPWGALQRFRCPGWVHAANTSGRGAAKTRVRLSFGLGALFSGLFLAGIGFLLLLLFGLQFLQVVLEAIETLLPEAPVLLHPVHRLLERRSLQPAGPPLGVARPLNQPAALQHAQVLGDRRQAHVVRLGQLGDGARAGRKPGKDLPPGGIGEGGEDATEAVGGHGVSYLTIWLIKKRETSSVCFLRSFRCRVGACADLMREVSASRDPTEPIRAPAPRPAARPARRGHP